jgi:CRP-like cAMP-binding protein
MALEVRLLHSEQLPSLYRFRYDVFFGELGALLSKEEIKRGYISDPLDKQSYNYGLCDGDTIVGSIRVVDLGRLTSTVDYEKKYRLEPLIDKFGLKSLCHVGRLALKSTHRSGTALARLILKSYEDGLRRGLKTALSDCSPYLLPLYEKLGYRQYAEPFNDPIYGLKVPIMLFPADFAYVSRIRSPVAKIAAEFSADPSQHEWFAATYPAYHKELRNRPQREPDWLDSNSDLLATEHIQTHSLFHGLSKEEIHKLLGQAILVSAQPGDYLIRKGLKENHLYFILEGVVEAVHANGKTLFQFGKGDFVGEMAYLTDSPRSADVVAKQPVRCILINTSVLSRLESSRPDLYCKIMRNIARALAVRLRVLALQQT